MLKEIDLFGVYIPPLALYGVIAVVAFMVVRRAITLLGFEALIWHPSLFDVALFTAILSVTTIAAFSAG